MIVLTASAAIALGSQVPRIVDQWRGNVTHGDFTLHVANQPQPLTLYGTTTCPHCVRARQYLVRAGIPFNDLILEASPETRSKYNMLRAEGVPVLVSRTGLVSGFNAEAFAELAATASQP